ncbi:hypothetical protein [Paenibacillus lemnae]|uniref:hypothetical protein n=1 Tax=Paenibacillus lemnae TaxID=1330551 RepID=UPI001B7D5291|nr:hypothetical protein [Paenibacillus lemnae]
MEFETLITASAIHTLYQANLGFDGKTHYMDYVTKPNFELKLNIIIELTGRLAQPKR